MTSASERVVGLCRRGRLPHGMLWLGADSEPKKGAVLDLAREIFCAEGHHAGACGVCLPCRKVERGIHPDLLFVAPENKEIQIEQIRNLARWLNVAPNEASRKIGVLEEADLLNTSSSNALLKTLEEPPAHALILLLARSASNLLPTVRSRLMPLRFPADSDGTPAESDRPSWGDDLERILKEDSRPAPDELFDLTETMAKDKEHLRWFFWASQRVLRDWLRAARETGATGRERRLETLFDLARATERDVLQRYGNTALGLDRLLTEWFL